MRDIVARPLVSDYPGLVDINTNYGSDGNGILVNDITLIQGEIFNVLTTLIGEEWEEPTYGSRVPVRLFDPITLQTAYLMEHDLDDAMRMWVPQIRVDLSKTRAIPFPDQRMYIFDIHYTILIYNLRRSYTVLLGPYTNG